MIRPQGYSSHAADGKVNAPIAVDLIRVAEPLVPRIPFVELRAGPIAGGIIGTTDIKSADRRAVIEQHTELALRRQTPVLVPVCLESLRVFHRLLPVHGERRIRRG